MRVEACWRYTNGPQGISEGFLHCEFVSSGASRLCLSCIMGFRIQASFLFNSFFTLEAISLILLRLSRQTVPIFLVMGRQHLAKTRNFGEHCATPTQTSPNPCHGKTAGYSDATLERFFQFLSVRKKQPGPVRSDGLSAQPRPYPSSHKSKWEMSKRSVWHMARALRC